MNSHYSYLSNPLYSFQSTLHINITPLVSSTLNERFEDEVVSATTLLAYLSGLTNQLQQSIQLLEFQKSNNCGRVATGSFGGPNPQITIERILSYSSIPRFNKSRCRFSVSKYEGVTPWVVAIQNIRMIKLHRFETILQVRILVDLNSRYRSRTSRSLYSSHNRSQ